MARGVAAQGFEVDPERAVEHDGRARGDFDDGESIDDDEFEEEHEMEDDDDVASIEDDGASDESNA